MILLMCTTEKCCVNTLHWQDKEGLPLSANNLGSPKLDSSAWESVSEIQAVKDIAGLGLACNTYKTA